VDGAAMSEGRTPMREGEGLRYSVLRIDKLKLMNHTCASHGLKAADAGGENR